MSDIPFVSIRQSKTELFEQFARVGKALSNGVRIEILDLLAQSERSVEALAEMLNQSIQNISRHLQILHQTKLITSRKERNFVFYRLADPDVCRLVGMVQGLAHRHLSEVEEIVERFASHNAEFEALAAPELLKRVERGEVLVVDVRPRLEFDAGHLPGALNVPLPDLEKRLRELPRDVEIVAYCRGRYCLMAYAAVDYLTSKGLDALRLNIGMSEWRLEQRPMVVENVVEELPQPRPRPRDQ
jgi:rhodanese-related sulfurtransferase/DNA-binding transcriptional ArsR family regulator